MKLPDNVYIELRFADPADFFDWDKGQEGVKELKRHMQGWSKRFQEWGMAPTIGDDIKVRNLPMLVVAREWMDGAKLIIKLRPYWAVDKVSYTDRQPDDVFYTGLSPTEDEE